MLRMARVIDKERKNHGKGYEANCGSVYTVLQEQRRNAGWKLLREVSSELRGHRQND
jgi:hypothetical protein